ncbi:MAG: hypothetical protein AAGJ40_01160 [Planctomycetota bacterium]
MTQLSLLDAISNEKFAVSPIPQPQPPAPSQLMALAELIRQDRRRQTGGPPQTRLCRIGDLAQSVLRRHDLVARRRDRARALEDEIESASAMTSSHPRSDRKTDFVDEYGQKRSINDVQVAS